MKRCISVLLVMVLCVTMSSCSSNKGKTRDSDSYLEGLDQGYEDVFLNLWRAASPGVNILGPEEVWETEHFSLIIVPIEEEGSYIKLKLTTYDLTMSECFEDQKMLFNVFSYDGSQFDGLLTENLFYMYATMEVYEEHYAHATVRLYEDIEKVAIIIVVDGCVYKASYNNE